MSINVKCIIIFLCFSSLSAIQAESQYTGFSSFAALNVSYPCSRFLQIASASKHPSMTVLLSTFGNDLTCVNRFLNKFKNKKHLLQIHLTNETCRRKLGLCSNKEIAHTLTTTPYNKALIRGNRAIKRAIEARALFVKDAVLPLTNKNTKLIVSTGLEDNYSNKSYVKVLSYVKSVLPKTLIARSPVTDRCYLLNGANYCELHLKQSYFNNYQCIWNNDGNLNSTNAQLSLFYKYSMCSVLFAWEPRSQGRGNGVGFVDVTRRSFVITNLMIKQYSNLIKTYESKKRS